MSLGGLVVAVKALANNETAFYSDAEAVQRGGKRNGGYNERSSGAQSSGVDWSVGVLLHMKKLQTTNSLNNMITDWMPP